MALTVQNASNDMKGHVSLQPFSRLTSLPTELLHCVLDYSTYDALYSLSRTCRSMRYHCKMPLEYRIVDLRMKDIRVSSPKIENHTMIESSAENFRYIEWPPRFGLTTLVKQQQAFTRKTLRRNNPHAAGWVRELHWTIRSYDGPRYTTKKGVDWDERMWELFEEMSNVRKLDLEIYQESWYWPYLRCPPSKLFPQATDIRLSGVMYREIVTAILVPTQMARLEHLTFDSLQDPGLWRGQSPFDVVAARRQRQEYLDSNKDQTRCPGPMRGILPLLTNCCPNLRSFRYRKMGWTHSQCGKVSEYDEAVYIEIAHFIQSVSQTLEIFTLEHGLSERCLPYYRNHSLENLSGIATGKNMVMDALMEKHIWPAMRQTVWPALQKVRLTVGFWKGKRGINFGNVSALRKHLGPSVEFKVVDISDLPCEWNLGA